jgi:hypothetical protein
LQDSFHFFFFWKTQKDVFFEETKEKDKLDSISLNKEKTSCGYSFLNIGEFREKGDKN